MPAVELINVYKSFSGTGSGRRVEVLRNFNLTLDSVSGRFIVLLGTSGCGKSTVIDLIAGLTEPDDGGGEVRVLDVPVRGPNPDVVTVPQSYTCFPWLTVLQNVEFGLRVEKRFNNLGAKERREQARQYLDKVGLGGREGAYPHQLSGGMQQRVAIARTLVMKKRVVLMDEPFGALDHGTRKEMQDLLLSLWSEEHNLILFVTHSIGEALLLADLVIVMPPSPSEPLCHFAVSLERPRDPSSSEFLRIRSELERIFRRDRDKPLQTAG